MPKKKSGSTPVRGVPGRLSKSKGKKSFVGKKGFAPAKPSEVTGGKQIEE